MFEVGSRQCYLKIGIRALYRDILYCISLEYDLISLLTVENIQVSWPEKLDFYFSHKHDPQFIPENGKKLKQTTRKI